jgi:hypothetical protein
MYLVALKSLSCRLGPERNADFSASAFIHFEGTNRFKGGYYLRCGRRVIGELSRQDT